MNPLNDDFNVVFIPFVNSLQASAPLTINSLGTASNPTSGISEQGVSLALNADGTVGYSESAALRALPVGQTVIDRFVYEATDGFDVDSGSVEVTWYGANDAPIVVNPIPSQVFAEDAAAVNFDLATVFNDVDLGDVLTYTIDPGVGGLLSATINGATLNLGPSANAFGYTIVTVTATDSFGATAAVSFSVSVTSVADNPLPVGDVASTNKLTAINIDALNNDYHPDTSSYSVAAANIYGNPLATTNETSVFSVVQSTPSPNQLTIQSAGNLGDVAVGRNGNNLSYNDGVLLGTVANATTPYQTVNTYNAFSSYGFATDTGIGGGERNSPINAAFFPYAEGWVSGHVGTSGNLISGVGVTQANIVKKGIGLWEVTIPGMNSSGAFFDSGLLFATVDSNNDNIISVNPLVGGGWEVRIVDSDALMDAYAGEDTPWSFVYVPATAPSLYGGHVADNGGFILSRQYGGVTAARDGSGLSITVPGYTPADGVMMAIVATSGFIIDPGTGDPISVPAASAVMATANGSNFRLEALTSNGYVDAEDQFYFMFIPYNQPQELIAGLDLEIASVSATSALGATVTLNSDGTINYNPATGGPAIADLLPGQSAVDTFTYTLTDNQVPPRTAIGTVTVTVTGENRLPTANADVINSNEVVVNGGRLTVLRNDTDPDLALIYGIPVGISSANLAVDGSGVWSVAQTGVGPNAITIGATATGSAEVLNNGNPISRNDGVVLASVREIQGQPNTNSRLVQAYTNSLGGTSLAISSFGVDQAANAQVAVSYFKFSDNWIGGHVASTGNLLAGNGLTASDVVRNSVGRYEVSIPGVSDSSIDGFLMTIGGDNADNVVSSRAIPGTNRYEVAVRDNLQDAANGEDGGFSFVFIPRTAENLVGGVVDGTSASPNSVTLGIGEFSLSRQTAPSGGFEWKLTIPGQSPTSGMLILANQNNAAVEDNYLSYQDDGAGSFIIRSQDMPNLGDQAVPFSFVYIPFDFASQPKFRPLTGGLTVQSVDATSARGASLSINSDGTILYSPGTIFDSMYDGDSQTDTFQYTMADGFGGTSSAMVTLNIAGVGQPVPVIFSKGSSYYALGDSPTSIDTGSTLGSSPTPFLNGSVLTVSMTAGAIASDQLVIRNEGTNLGQVGVSDYSITYSGTVIATFTGGNNANPIVVTFNSAATLDGARAVLRAVSFSNTDSATVAGTRTFSAVLVDGNGKSATPSTKTMNLGLVRRRTFQQNVDHGFGPYAGVADIELSQVTPSVPQPTGRVAADGLLVDQGTTDQTHVLLRFADIFGNGIGQIPTDAIITSAKLTLDTRNSGNGGTMHRLLTDFDFNLATWDSTGAGIQANGIEANTISQSQVGVASANGTTGSGATSVGVLADILAWQSGETNYGWAFLPHATGTDGWGFSASETANAALRPQLNIEWLPAGTEVASFRQGVNGYNSAVDTYLQQGTPTATADTATTIWVDFDAVNNNHVLLRFDEIIGSTLGQIPQGSTVISAKLTLAGLVSNAPGDGGTFHTMLADWGNDSTWSSLTGGIQPDGLEASITPNTTAGSPTLDANVVGGYNTFDVTTDVQSWVDATIANKGWAILPWATGSDGWAIQSSESTNPVERPILQVYYIPNTNTAPTLTRALESVTGGVRSTLTNTGTWSDPDAGDVVTLTASIGSVVKNGDGTWNWSLTPAQPLAAQVVTITATDDEGASSQVTFTVTAVEGVIVNSFVMHGGSASFTGDNRIDTGKSLAKEGSTAQTLSINNLINTTRGINLVAFEVQNLAGTVTGADFVFQMSPQGAFAEGSNPPSGWAAAPPASSVVVTSSGANSRVTIAWPNNAIENRWLRISVLANANTGMVNDQVFYLGHLRGEVTGAQAGQYIVNNSDAAAIATRVSGAAVPVTSIYDLDKNSRVLNSDIGAMAGSIGLLRLRNITIPAAPSGLGGLGSGGGQSGDNGSSAKGPSAAPAAVANGGAGDYARAAASAGSFANGKRESNKVALSSLDQFFVDFSTYDSLLLDESVETNKKRRLY